MTKNEYNAYIEALKEHGYIYMSDFHSNYYYKVIEFRDDEDGNRRAVCQLLFYLLEQEDNRSGYVYYSIEPAVMVSRHIDERLNFTIGLTKRSVEECERIAKEFLRWVDVYVDIK